MGRAWIYLQPLKPVLLGLGPVLVQVVEDYGGLSAPKGKLENDVTVFGVGVNQLRFVDHHSWSVGIKPHHIEQGPHRCYALREVLERPNDLDFGYLHHNILPLHDWC